MKTCILLGSNSDIAKGLEPLLAKDYKIVKWSRGSVLPLEDWDLVVCCIGSVAPVGLWHSVDEVEWLHSIESNLITPFRLLQKLWPTHNPGASVCFMAGSNPQMIMDGYSAYNCGKMGLLKLVEQMDHETPDAKFFALGPGTILTKIHQATTKAGWDNPKLDAALAKNEARLAPLRVWEAYARLDEVPENAKPLTELTALVALVRRARDRVPKPRARARARRDLSTLDVPNRRRWHRSPIGSGPHERLALPLALL